MVLGDPLREIHIFLLRSSGTEPEQSRLLCVSFDMSHPNPFSTTTFLAKHKMVKTLQLNRINLVNNCLWHDIIIPIQQTWGKNSSERPEKQSVKQQALN